MRKWFLLVPQVKEEIEGKRRKMQGDKKVKGLKLLSTLCTY
jgi:hypothetical protein